MNYSLVHKFCTYIFPISIGQCQRPSSGCSKGHDRYKNVDCDGDGILDHACSTIINNDRWLVLSSEGCPSSWGPSTRPVSMCPQAFGGTYDIYTVQSRFSDILFSDKSRFSDNFAEDHFFST